MTNEQIEKAAQQHADERFPILLDTLSTNPWPDVKLFLAHAFVAGAKFTLAAQWISVNERLPEPFVDVVAQLKSGISYIAYHNGEEWIALAKWTEIKPAFWMPIPQLNPEREDI